MSSRVLAAVYALAVVARGRLGLLGRANPINLRVRTRVLSIELSILWVETIELRVTDRARKSVNENLYECSGI